MSRLPRGRRRVERDLRTEIAAVVRAGNCTGCGGCALLSSRVSMALDDEGFQRPVWHGSELDDHGRDGHERDGHGRDGHELEDHELAERFATVCPGVGITELPRSGRSTDPTLGSYVSVWAAWSTDSEIRHAGSSGGVLTALSAWLLATEQATHVVGATSDAGAPLRTVTQLSRSRDDALDAAGSRYAPVAMLTAFDPLDPRRALIGKPCEAYAAHRLSDSPASDAAVASSSTVERPLLLSFFCAGTPSQQATEALVAELGTDPRTATSLRYRGEGWPGRFVVTDSEGRAASLSYDESWGKHLGRQVQQRCRICPDGTGGHADIAVGDFWETDDRGYPVFLDAPGTSVAVARTQRGHELLLAARTAGVLDLRPVTAAEVSAVQPLQRLRRQTLAGRLIGRRVAGFPVPAYQGFGLLGRAVRAPRRNLEFLRGTLYRSRRDSR